MKKLISFFALLAFGQLCYSQLMYEGGLSPLTSRLRPAISISPVYSVNRLEFSLPVSYEHKHNVNAGGSFGYRFNSDAESILEGLTVHAGAGFSWHVPDALKSGEVVNKFFPIVGVKFVSEGERNNAGIFEIRYQGGTFLILFGIRFN